MQGRKTVYYDPESKVVSLDRAILGPESYIISAYEAASRTQNRNWLSEIERESDYSEYVTHRLEFALVVEKQLPDEELKELFCKYRPTAILLRNTNWSGVIYHYSNAPDAVIREGWRPMRSTKDEEALSYGQGLYCYYDKSVVDSHSSSDLTLLSGHFEGDLYTVLVTDEGDDHLTHGFIPYGYQNIKWERYGKDSKNVDETSVFK